MATLAPFTRGTAARGATTPIFNSGASRCPSCVTASGAAARHHRYIRRGAVAAVETVVARSAETLFRRTCCSARFTLKGAAISKLICAALAVLVVSCGNQAATEPSAEAPESAECKEGWVEQRGKCVPGGGTDSIGAKDNTTEPSRPRWCSHYDDWKRASDTIDDIAARHGSNVTRWPDGVYEQWKRAFDQQMRAGDILWDGTEAGAVPRGWDARASACR